MTVLDLFHLNQYTVAGQVHTGNYAMLVACEVEEEFACTGSLFGIYVVCRRYIHVLPLQVVTVH